MKLPLVNVFERPYEVWSYRDLSSDEMHLQFTKTGIFEFATKTTLIERIQTHFDAACYMIQRQVDNGLESHVDQQLRKSLQFEEMLDCMPKNVPASIAAYQNSYPACDLQQVSEEIKRLGGMLWEGQTIFHGGVCPCELGEIFTTNRPLSTSFCPQVGLRNAEWQGKAYEFGEVHLLVLRVTSPTVSAFIFPREGELANEKEILISSGVMLQAVSKSLIRSDYSVCKMGSNFEILKKQVPAYVVEIAVA